MSDALREVFAEFGIKFDDKALKDGAKSVGGMVARIRELGAMLAGNAIVGAIRDFAGEFEEQSGALEDNAAALGITTRALQELRFAAVSAGLSAEQADASLQRFQQSVAGAASGSKAQADAFRALGVNVRDAGGHTRDVSAIMDDVAAGLGAVEDPTRRAQLAVDIFGGSGARLATVLHEGEGGLAELRAELGELGGGMLPEAIEAAGAYGAAMDANRVASASLRSVLATALLPSLTWLVTWLTRAEAWLVRMTRGTHVAELALVALGGAAVVQAGRMLLAWAPVLLPFAKIALAAAAVVLVVDDLITLFKGGDSVIGRFIDSMFGVGSSQRFVQELKDAWEGLQLFVHDFIGDLPMLKEGLSEVWQGAKNDVNSFFAEVGAFFAGIRRGADEMVTPFVNAWNTIKAAFDATFGPIIARINSLVETVRGFAGLDTVASGAAGALRGLLPSGSLRGLLPSFSSSPSRGVGDIEMLAEAFRNDDPHRLGAGGFIADAVAEWRDVFGGGNAALAPPATAPAAPTQRAVTSHRTVNVGNIVVQGAASPEATARAVHARIRSAERATHDAAHPVRAED